MRVLMVSDVYFPRINGVSTSIETFRKSLREEGIEVRLVVPGYGNDTPVPDVIRVPGRSIPGDREDRLVQWGAMHRAVAAAAHDCDLIHIQTPFVAHYAGLRAARRRGLPVLATYHTLFEEYLEHYAPFLPAAWLRQQARALSRRQCNALDAVVVPSSAMRQRLESYGVSKPMHVLPTGIPLQQFAHGDRAGFRQRHAIATGRPVALFVGRVAHEKNIGFLLQAMTHALKHCPDCLLVIAGEGPAMGSLKRQAEDLGLASHVRFIGYLEREKSLPDCYAAADAFVFASQTETQGLVLLEAMAAGLPVIALAEMGTVDILASGRGSLVPPADPLRFGDTLGHFLAQPDCWPKRAAEARQQAAEWSDRAMSRRLATCYRELILTANWRQSGCPVPVGPSGSTSSSD